MNKNHKFFNFLYYLCFILVISIFLSYKLYFFPKYSYGSDMGLNEILISSLWGDGLYYTVLFFVNVFLVICFTILLLIKKEIKNVNILFPVIFIIYLIVLNIVAILFNDRVMFPGSQYEYYLTHVYAGYLFLNVYALLSIDWKKKKIVEENIESIQTSDVMVQQQNNNMPQTSVYTQQVNQNITMFGNNHIN